MDINRRRAPSAAISSEKKRGGHKNEDDFALLIGGEVIHGKQKADVRDNLGNHFSLKSGKKWQIFLYGPDRIRTSKYLNVLKNCVDAFSEDAETYFTDRVKCIAYKEDYIRKYGRDVARNLSNETIAAALGHNEYMASKQRLMAATTEVMQRLEVKENLYNFLDEAMFNCNEVNLIAIKDTTLCKDNKHKVFAKSDVLKIFCDRLSVTTSSAGNTPEDYNVGGQKTLLRYNKNGRDKNFGEIEVRNDSVEKYRSIRFNMYSADALSMLLKSEEAKDMRRLNDSVLVYGNAIKLMQLSY